MALDNFFDPDETKNENSSNAKYIENNNSPKSKENNNKPSKTPSKSKEKWAVTHFDVGQNLDDLFLLDVIYNGENGLARALFYHEPTRSIYKWDDTTNHKPYFYTDYSIESIEKIDEIFKSEEFGGFEEIKLYKPILGKEVKLTKVYGTNPLAIGGKDTSFRNHIDIAYEADIRYHLNYIADRHITPGTYYTVKNGELIPSVQKIDDQVKTQLYAEFANENEDEIDMLNEYMPLLFQPIPDILRCAFDIEVGSEKGKLPNPNRADEEVISIAIMDSDGLKKCWVLKRSEVDQTKKFDDIEVVKFENEVELLLDFFEFIDSYPIVISFNGDNFDAPFLINRALKLNISEANIPFIAHRNDVGLKNSIHIDLYQFFKQASIRLYAFSGKYDSTSLDELSSALLNEGKLEHPDVWINEMDLNTLVTYNVKDAELTLKLTQFDDNITMNLMFILMRISKMPLYDFSRTAVSGWLKNWLVYEHKKRNYLIPRKQDILSAKGSTAMSEAIIDGKKFQGAIVLDPKPGVWWDVTVLDFASLYPSIIKTKNLSYETIRCEHDECKSNVVPEVNHWICEKRNGLFAILLGFVRDTRVKWFKERAKKGGTELERRISNIIQSSLKVLINAGYGVLGSESFDFYCPPVAESTTAFARDAIKSTKEFVETELKIKVLYGDTDSLFLYKPGDQNIQRLIDWGNQNIKIELGIDYEFRYVVFTDRKKNYFGVTKNNIIIVKGLMGKKSNTPPIIREHFSEILQILKKVNNVEEFEKAKDTIKSNLKKLVNKLENETLSAEEISTRLTLTRKVTDYETWTQTLQAVAQLINSGNFTANDFDVGDTIDFIKLEDPIRVITPAGLSFPPGELKSSNLIPVQLVDDSTLISGKPILEVAESTFSQILSTIGINWEKILGHTSLDEWF